MKKPTTGTPMPIHKMDAGEVFFFTSTKKRENSAYYVKQNTKKSHSALHLGNFKVMVFNSPTDMGIPVTAEFLIKEQKSKK